jgi:hypothetical protein
MQACERLITLRRRLPGLARGHDQPNDQAEWLEFATLCQEPFECRYALASRLYAEIFRADPRLAEDPRSLPLHQAALAAARAGCGQGTDTGQLDEPEKARLRGQALSWLQSELNFWTSQFRSDRLQGRTAAQQLLGRWLTDPNLAGVRDPTELIKLPQHEREAWQRLWQQVEAAH